MVVVPIFLGVLSVPRYGVYCSAIGQIGHLVYLGEESVLCWSVIGLIVYLGEESVLCWSAIGLIVYLGEESVL